MTFEELHAQPVVAEETPAVEPETTEDSTPEIETTTETPDEAPADVSDQPEEEVDKTPRAQKRIQELTRKNKELEEKAAYWDQLNAQVPDAPVDENEDGTVTVEAIADTVIRKQQAISIEEKRIQAQADIQRSAAEALEAYPELETDDYAASVVLAYAKENKISLKASADQFYARASSAAKKAETKKTADQAMRVGASTPSGNKVSNGQLPPPNISSMSEEEKAANWDTILSSMS